MEVEYDASENKTRFLKSQCQILRAMGINEKRIPRIRQKGKSRSVDIIHAELVLIVSKVQSKELLLYASARPPTLTRTFTGAPKLRRDEERDRQLLTEFQIKHQHMQDEVDAEIQEDVRKEAEKAAAKASKTAEKRAKAAEKEAAMEKRTAAKAAQAAAKKKRTVEKTAAKEAAQAPKSAQTKANVKTRNKPVTGVHEAHEWVAGMRGS